MSHNRLRSGETFSRLAAGGYGRYLLPAVIFQSVVMGGGYTTGREVVQYGARFGALGVWNIFVIFVGFALIAMLVYEFARVTRSYNYRTFMRRLIGRLWPLFDVLFIAIAILTIAVIGSATGEVGEDILGLPYLVGVGFVILLVAVLNFFGRGLIERFKTVGTMLVYLMWIALAVSILAVRWENVPEVFADKNAAALDSSSFLNSPTVVAAVVVGILYVSYNAPSLVPALFVLDRQTTRKETVVAGVLTGVLAVIPFTLTYLCVLSFYPSDEVLGAPVPWVAMLGQVGSGLLTIPFALVVIYTLVETATGYIHSMTDRISDSLRESGRSPLTGTQRALFSGVVLVAAALLSQVGIIDLVATGYSAMAYAFLVVFLLPLATIGFYKIVNASGEQ